MTATRIIRDHPLAHEDVMLAWQAQEKCVVVPSRFHNPRAYVEAHAGGPGLFLYMTNDRGGYDLTHVTWLELERRLQNPIMRPFATRVISMFDNGWSYGLTLGRLFTVYHGGVVIPYRGGALRAGRDAVGQSVETVYGIGSFFGSAMRGEPPQPNTLKSFINVCSYLTPETVQDIQAAFPSVKVYNHYALPYCGTIAFAEARAFEPGEVGDLTVPAEVRDGQIFVKSPTTYAAFDLGEGWCATGRRGRIEGNRLFVEGDLGAGDFGGE